jgi:hypothetical protein
MNNTLVPGKFWLQENTSTEDAAFKLKDKVLKSINQKMYVRGNFCDLAQDSDCVNYDVLLTELHFYGVQRIAANWFKPCFMDRKQKVKIKSPNNT